MPLSSGWNPLLTADYNVLPNCSSSIPGYLGLLRFNYNSSIDDYKVMRAIISSTYCTRSLEHKVEMYSLKTNSWKRIHGVPYGNLFIHNRVRGGTLVNGFIYWVATDPTDNEEDEGFGNLILAFDLIDEKFILVGTPRDDDLLPEWAPSLVEVRGCLVCIKHNTNVSY